jgi:hypothetical protein
MAKREEAQPEEQPEPRTPMRSEGMSKAPNQWEEGNRRIKAANLADFLRKRGITDVGLQTMHPQILQHHIRSAGLKSPPSEATMKLVAQHLKPSRRQPTDPFAGL